MPTFARDFTDETLENAPAVATQLLTGIGAIPEVRTLLEAAGMTDEDIIEGRTLLLACLAAPSPSPATDTEQSRAQRAATAELDAWDDLNFPRHMAALARRYVSAAELVFANLAPARGQDSVRGVATLLTRVEALEKGTDPNRSGSRDDDKKAVALLARRGLDKDERERLAKLVNIALGPTPSLAAPPVAPQTARRSALLELKLWCNEWSTVAHAVIKKRSHLIRLGLATRRSPRVEDPPETGTTPPRGTP
jgi:hypothetical protein